MRHHKPTLIDDANDRADGRVAVERPAGGGLCQFWGVALASNLSAYANASNQSVEFAQRTERSTIKAELKIQQITGRVRMTHDR